MKKALAHISLIICLCSCHPYYYYPSYQEIPTQTKKNEIHITGSAPALRDPDGNISAISGSYTITDHIGVIGAFNHHNRSTHRSDFDDSSTNGKDSYLADIGAFYYGVNSFHLGNYPVEATHAMVGAYSYGKQQEYSELYSININRAYLQPSIGLTSKFIDLGLSMRLSYVNFGLEQASTIEFNRASYNLFSIEDHNYYFIEPQLFARLGYKWVKVGLYINTAHNLTKHEIEYDEGNIGLMFHFQYKLDDLFHAKDK